MAAHAGGDRLAQQLLTEATAEAIDTGAERITTRLMDRVDIGYAAEVGAGRQQPRQAA